jgi:hypothetical protein
LPNQYARVKNLEKGEDVIKDITDQIHAFVDEFLKEAKKVQLFMKQMKILTMNISHQTIMLMQHFSQVILCILNLWIYFIYLCNSLKNQFMNILYLPEKYLISILGDGADTCVLGQGWEVLSVHNTRRASEVGIDHEALIKVIFRYSIQSLQLTLQMEYQWF